MKDLDFDELDKAVSSLMSQTGTSTQDVSIPVSVTPQSDVKSERKTESVSVQTLTSSPNLQDAVPSRSPNQALVKTTPVSSQSIRATSQPTQSFAAPIKRSGRFMDLVPGSSGSQRPVSTPGSREGIALSPLSEPSKVDNTASVATVKPNATVAAVTPEVSSSPKRAFSRSASSQSISPLAASIALSSRTAYDSGSSASDQVRSDEDNVEPVETQVDFLDTSTKAPPVSSATSVAASSPVDGQSHVSPFLSDAKVDKRPLGSGNSVQPENVIAQDMNKGLRAQEVTTVPTELNKDLMAVESGRRVSLSQASGVVQMNQEPAEVAPVSIAQQYKQQPRSGDQSHVAVYDTAAHPVAHPDKKKSSLLVGIMISLIVLIGVGGFAILFYLGYI